MRKHSVRKWLHAILDLLPVIILPIFAIYSHRHTIDSYEVTVPQNQVVTFNQLVSYDEAIVFTPEDSGQLGFQLVDVSSDSIFIFKWYQDVTLTSVLRNTPYYTDTSGNYFYSTSEDSDLNSGYYYWRFETSLSFSLGYWGHTPNVTYSVSEFQLFNLTTMFGVGNEPTTEQFNQWYTEDYYEYNTGTKELLKDVSTVTYDNTDIGSQMIYSLYKPINDYFNLNNVFNFGAIYDWFELNMFNGNAPLSIFIVWNIIVYEFIMDIIFLIYSVFMFVIDFACETLDRFTGWAKRGD